MLGIVAVVVAFFICWAPFQVQRLYAIYGFSTVETTPNEILVYKVMTYASGLLYYLSTTINPILYNIMSLKFRQAFKVYSTFYCPRLSLTTTINIIHNGKKYNYVVVTNIF